MKYLIFDMDGTLIDSMPAWAEAELDMLKHFEIDRRKVTEIDKLEQLSFSEVAEYLMNYTKVTNSPQEIVDYMNMQTDYFYSTKSTLKNGIKEFLSFMKNKGIKMSVASSTDNVKAIVALKQFEIYEYFEYIFTNDILHSNKSQSKFWQEISRTIQVPTSEMILFDDAIYALTGAKESSIFTVGLRDHQSDEKFKIIKEISDIATNNIEDLDPEQFFEEHIKK